MTRTKTDTTIDDIHAIRRETSDRFNGDVFAIARDAARRQLESNRPLWRPNTTNNPMHVRTGDDLNTSG